MGGSVSVPGPSEEERALQAAQADQLRKQTAILERQERFSTVMTKFIATQEGFEIKTNEAGEIIDIQEGPSELREIRKEIEAGLLDRTRKALKGELPVDPGLEEGLRVNEQDLREKLARQIGPGWETSSPGIEAMAAFKRDAEILRSGARNQQLTLAEQLGITREQQEIFRRQSGQDAIGQSSQAVPLALAGAFGQNAAGYGRAQEPFIRQREMQLNAAIANQRNSASMFGAGLGFAGSVLGLFSDSRLKEDLEQIGWHSELDVPIYSYRYVGESTRHIGVLAEDVAVRRPDLVGERYGWLTVDYHEVT